MIPNQCHKLKKKKSFSTHFCRVNSNDSEKKESNYYSRVKY